MRQRYAELMLRPLGHVMVMFAVSCSRPAAESSTREAPKAPTAEQPLGNQPAGMPKQRPASADERAQPFAVVELFTSEGCSSCPPADENLARLSRQAQEKDLRVFVLSFHVDYWNYLGWRDPFSDERYSLRQRRYAAQLSGGRVYTPQMVVNGESEFVGSHQGKSNDAVERALETPAKVWVELSSTLAGDTLRLDYQVAGAPGGATLSVAAVHGAKDVLVARGENAGRSLSHVGVVRAFRSVVLTGDSGKLELGLPASLPKSDLRVVAYVQDGFNLRVLGAQASTPRPGSG